MSATDIEVIIAAVFAGLNLIAGTIGAIYLQKVHANTKPWEPPMPPSPPTPPTPPTS